jgi:hypothetical protein
MKTYLTYGFLLALAGFLFTLVLFLFGLQSDMEKMQQTQWIVRLGSIAIGVTFTVLGVKAQRAAVPASEEFTYGKAFGAGFGVQAFAALFGGVFTYLYLAVINPALMDRVREAATTRIEQRGATGPQLDQIMKVTHLINQPVPFSIIAAIFTLVFGAVIALVVAAFLRREAGEPPVTA